MNKKVYFEIMRIVACGLVIFNHISGYGLYGISSGLKQFFYMCLTMVIRINVPLFFMISGALLLKKEENIVVILRKRIFRIITVISMFDGIILTVYKILAVKQGVEYEYTIKRYLTGVLTNHLDGTNAYWYMYAYLGFLFMLPFMQRIAKEFSKSEFWTLLILHLLTSSFIPIINIALSNWGLQTIYLCGDFQVPLAFVKAFFYPLMGYYLEYNVDIFKLKKKHIMGLVVTGCIGILLSNFCTYYEGITTGAYTQNYVQLFDYLTSIVVLLIIKYIFAVKWSENVGVEKVICLGGSLTFGIYLLDPILRAVFYEKYNTWAEPMLPTLIVSFGWVMISMVCGGGITYIMKRIPGVRKVI